MPQAQGSQVKIDIIPEVTYGVTPASPATKYLEFVSFEGQINYDTLTDESITPSRQTSYARSGNKSVEATLEVVMAPDNFDTLFEAALMGTWTSNVLKVGSVNRSFALQQGFTDLGQYRVFNGMKVNTVSMAVTTDQLITTTFGFFGSSGTAFTGTPIDASPDPVPQKEKFFHEGGTFIEDGVTIGYLSEISWELNNNVTGTYALGNTGYRSVNTGKVEITGKVTALFESPDLYNKLLTNEDTSLSYTVTAGSPAETLTYFFPRIKYTSGNVIMDGDAGVTVELEWTALYDATDATSLTITRSV